jgi:hypothetical protein
MTVTVRHQHVDEVRRSRGVLPPLSRPQFPFHSIPPLFGCFRIQNSMPTIFNADHILREASSFVVAGFASNCLQFPCAA